MPANINSFGYAAGTAAPWHGIGNTVNPDGTVDDWAEQAGFDWTVETSPIFYRTGNQAQQTDKYRLFYRSDKPDVVLGMGSDKFHISQPREFLEFLHQFGQETGCELSTAGILGEGEKFFVLLDAHQSQEIVPGEGPTQKYILGASANNGSMSSTFKGTDVRTVCQNTLTMAMRDGLPSLNITHRQKIEWNQVRNWLKGEAEDFQLYGDLMGELAKIELDARQMVEFSKDLLAPEWNPKLKPSRPRSLVRFLDTLQHGEGQKEAGRNAYGLINGVTRYVDHDKQARGQESRLNSAWFGQGAAIKQNAMDLLLKSCVDKWGARSQLQPVLSETRYSNLLEVA